MNTSLLIASFYFPSTGNNNQSVFGSETALATRNVICFSKTVVCKNSEKVDFSKTKLKKEKRTHGNPPKAW